MAKQVTVPTAKAGAFTSVYAFYQDVRSEMSKVAWPSKEELKGHTQVVVVLLLVLLVIIGVFDWVFLNVISQLIKLV
jgi:preprotein translocase subunit SecE